MKTNKEIINLAEKIQDLIKVLYTKEPNNKTFDQEGMLNGFLIVKEYLDEGEELPAVEHLLYMFYESDIAYTDDIIEDLNKLVSKYKIKSPYY